MGPEYSLSQGAGWFHRPRDCDFLVSVPWWVRLVWRLEQAPWRARMGPRDWCLPTGRWIWVLGPPGDRAVSRGVCGSRILKAPCSLVSETVSLPS